MHRKPVEEPEGGVVAALSFHLITNDGSVRRKVRVLSSMKSTIACRNDK